MQTFFTFVRMTTRILLKPHLAKFITELYGNPVVLPAKTELSYWFKVFLCKNFELIPANADGKIAVNFAISENIAEGIGHTFPLEQMEFFNLVLTRYFNATTYAMMLFLVNEKKMSERSAAVALHTRLGLEDHEYTIEAFRFNQKMRKKTLEEFFLNPLPTTIASCTQKQ